MDLLALVDNMSQEMYLRLKCAAETGKWPEGGEVAKEQQASSLQIIMAYQARHLNSDDIMTIGSDGNIVTKSKREIKAEFKADAAQTNKNTSSLTDSNTIARFPNL